MRISAVNTIQNNNNISFNRRGKKDEQAAPRSITGEDIMVLSAKCAAAAGIAAIGLAVLKENNIHPEKMLKNGFEFLKARIFDTPLANNGALDKMQGVFGSAS